jgi:hypothetical protein
LPSIGAREYAETHWLRCEHSRSVSTCGIFRGPHS